MPWTYSDPFAGAEKMLSSLCDRVCEETAQEVLEQAQKNAPLDKGALRASGYVATSRESGAAEAQAAAKAANPGAELSSPFIVEDWDEGVSQAVVDFLAIYAMFVAYGYQRGGTRNGTFVPGRDFLGIAMSQMREKFYERAQRELDGLSRK